MQNCSSWRQLPLTLQLSFSIKSPELQLEIETFCPLVKQWSVITSVINNIRLWIFHPVVTYFHLAAIIMLSFWRSKLAARRTAPISKCFQYKDDPVFSWHTKLQWSFYNKCRTSGQWKKQYWKQFFEKPNTHWLILSIVAKCLCELTTANSYDKVTYGIFIQLVLARQLMLQ